MATSYIWWTFISFLFVFTSFIFMFVTFISNLNFIMLCREGDPKVLQTLIDSQCSFRYLIGKLSVQDNQNNFNFRMYFMGLEIVNCINYKH